MDNKPHPKTINPDVIRREVDKTLTVQNVMKLTGVHERTVRRWIGSEKIKSFIIGKERRFTAESVIDFLDDHKPEVYNNFRVSFLAEHDPQVRAAFEEYIRSGGVSA